VVYPDPACPACLVYLAAEHHAHGYNWQPTTGRTDPDWQIEDGDR
jgi:hypothetical protein